MAGLRFSREATSDYYWRLLEGVVGECDVRCHGGAVTSWIGYGRWRLVEEMGSEGCAGDGDAGGGWSLIQFMLSGAAACCAPTWFRIR